MAAFQYKFSVGTISLEGLEMAKCTGISVSFDGSPVPFYGADYRYPLALELGNQSCEISVENAKFSLENFPGDSGGSSADLLTNSLVDVVLGEGVNGGGLTGTIKNCKVVSLEVTSQQDDFIQATVVLQKVQYVT